MSSSTATDRKRARRIAVLRRRADHLEQRIAADPDRPVHWDRAEAAALRWALDKLDPQPTTEGLAT